MYYYDPDVRKIDKELSKVKNTTKAIAKRFEVHPYFIMIDDDGQRAFYEIQRDVYAPRGITPGLSICFSDQLFARDEFLKPDELHALEDSGHTIINHSASITSLLPDTAESTMRYSIAQYNRYGFHTPEFFAYPNGNQGLYHNQIMGIAQGLFKYAFDVNHDSNVRIPIPLTTRTKWNLGRFFIAPTQTQAAMDYMKRMADEAIANNSMYILSTHANQTNKQDLCEILDYVINKGYRWMSPAEAFNELNDSLTQFVGNTIDEREDELERLIGSLQGQTSDGGLTPIN